MSASVMKLKSTWLKQVMQDNGLPPLAFKFAYVLCGYINHETGVAWPSMPTLANDASISERSAWRFAESLKERGHLIVTPGGGRASTNKYQISVKADAKPCKPVRVSSHKNPAAMSGINPANLSGFERINPDSACIKTLPLRAGDIKENLKKKNAAGAHFSASPKSNSIPAISPSGNGVGDGAEAELFRRGKEILGRNSGGLVKRLLTAKDGIIPKALAALESASTKHDPREYVGATLRNNARERESDDSW